MTDRFVVRECEGYSELAGSSRGPGYTVTVLDSAYCYAVMLRLRTEDQVTGGRPILGFTRTKEGNRARLRGEAGAFAAELNAKHA